MPSVPMLNRPQVAPNVRRAIDVPVASTGAGAAAMGLSVAADAFQKERERAGQIRANAAEAEIRQVSSRLATEVEQMQRTQALGAEDFVAEKWGSEVSRITAGISDPAVREAVEARANILRDELQGRARTHASRESERARVEDFRANQASDLEALTKTPDIAPRVLGSIEQRTRDNSRAEGKSDEVIAMDVAQAVSAAQYARVVGLVQSNRTEEAATLLEQPEFRGSLQAKELQDAQRLVKVESMAVRSQEARDKILARFPDNEVAAERAARDELKGEMEDEVVNRIRDVFSARRRRNTETRTSLAEQASDILAANNGDLAAIPPSLARTLQVSYASTWKNLEGYATQLRTGAPIDSDPVVLDAVTRLGDEELRDLDLTQYQSKLDVADFQSLQKRQQKALGKGVGGMTTLDIANDVFRIAQQSSFFRTGPRSMADLQRSTTDNALFRRMNLGAREAIDALRQEKKRPLTKTEIRNTIQQVMSDVVVEGIGMFDREIVLPRTASTRATRELTDAERAGRGLGPSIPPQVFAAPLSPAAVTRAQALAAEGKTKEQATAILRAEGLLPPTP